MRLCKWFLSVVEARQQRQTGRGPQVTGAVVPKWGQGGEWERESGGGGVYAGKKPCKATDSVRKREICRIVLKFHNTKTNSKAFFSSMKTLLHFFF